MVITGSAGLVGSEASVYFGRLGLDVVGIDNDMRRVFFGDEASTAWNIPHLQRALDQHYHHYSVDVRDRAAIQEIFARYGHAILLVIHCAAQPSHDWAAREPFVDFDINAGGTLNVLEATRQHAPRAVFIYMSTNKVYGDTPNRLPLVELETRYEISSDHPYAGGIREDMTIDCSLHSLFGVSKLAGDVLVQEYGRYFEMFTACFRGGTLTGPQHSATQLHGFLAYVMRCTMTGSRYTVFGCKGKQVRDVIQSKDLVRAFDAFFRRPRVAAVYNIGGGRVSNCSVIEAIRLSEQVTGRELKWSYTDQPRLGDHVWWIGDNSKFQCDYPEWHMEYDLARILDDMYEAAREGWVR